MHEEKSREKTEGKDSQLKESDVRATSRTVRITSRTSGQLSGPSEQLRTRRPEGLLAMSDRPEATPDRPDPRRTVRAAPRTVRIITPEDPLGTTISRTVWTLSRTVRPQPGPSDLRAGRPTCTTACAQKLGCGPCIPN